MTLTVPIPSNPLSRITSCLLFYLTRSVHHYLAKDCLNHGLTRIEGLRGLKTNQFPPDKGGQGGYSSESRMTWTNQCTNVPTY